MGLFPGQHKIYKPSKEKQKKSAALRASAQKTNSRLAGIALRAFSRRQLLCPASCLVVVGHAFHVSYLNELRIRFTMHV
jgi:hypothetical protein